MTIHSRISLFLLGLAFAAGLAPLGAQNVEPGASDSAPANLQAEGGNALDRHLASQEVEILQRLNLTDIRRLAVLVANFGTQVQGTAEDLTKIKELYREAQEAFYTRRYLLSRSKHREAHELARAAYGKFADRFQRQLSEIITQLSSQIVDQEMTFGTEPGQVANYQDGRRIRQGAFKLQLAYQQSANARQMLNEQRPDLAVDHLRLAKRFAISALSQLQNDPAKQREVADRYHVDLLDAEGLSGNQGQQGGASS
ncbi:MAG: hypothetical protein K1X75_08930 [Leptospirales bacterium]|nr:hypothetical protein [Leptospirales bacterium]